MKRNNKGQFIYTTGAGIYKRKINNGHNKQYSRFVWELNFGEIPKGLVVHHLDKNKTNDNINNLSLMTITAHNRIHSHPAWNKGKSPSSETINKIQEKRTLTFLPRFKETNKLRMAGKKLQEIADIQNISRRQVSDRLKRFKNLVEV